MAIEFIVMCPVKIVVEERKQIHAIWQELKDAGVSMHSSDGSSYEFLSEKVRLKDCYKASGEADGR